MYHINDDKRCRRSCAIIYDALTSLISEKPFDKITVTDIQDKSYVGRATFYRNFDSITDVLIMKSDEESKGMASDYLKLLKETDQNNDEGFGIVEFFFNYWHENTEIIETLLSINRIDILYNSLTNAYESLADTIFPELDVKSEDYKYLIAMKISIGVGFLTKWISEGKNKTVDELIKILHNGFQTASKYLLSNI